jgi:hypothetical protein
MKIYYVECSVSYSDNMDEEIYVGAETYSMIINANSKKIAETKAKLEAKKLFMNDLGDNYTTISDVEIEQSYETSEDARSS